MGQPAAKQGDTIEGKDIHMVKFPNGVVTPVPLDFKGVINGTVSFNVRIMGAPAATVGSIAKNDPEHKKALSPDQDLPAKPNNEGKIRTGSETVRINGNAAARNGDPATTCRELPGPEAKVVATGSVLIG
jgi:uncharacterized Zn-binding protein involved in type VI secretion